MQNLSGGMKSLCEDIVAGNEGREKDIKDLREQAGTIRGNARKFASNCKKLHQEMAKDLRKNLIDNRKELIKNVNVLRKDFREKEKEVRADLAEASKIWKKMNETLRSKKSKSKKKGR